MGSLARWPGLLTLSIMAKTDAESDEGGDLHQ